MIASVCLDKDLGDSGETSLMGFKVIELPTMVDQEADAVWTEYFS